MRGQGEGETMNGAEATTILFASKLPPPKERPEQIVARGQQSLDAFLGGAAAKEKRTTAACDGGDATKEPRRRSQVFFEVVVTDPAVLALLLDAGRGEDPGFHARVVSALLNIPRGVMPLYRLAERALRRQTRLMGDTPPGKGDDRARKDCADESRELINGLCHLVNDTVKCYSGDKTLDSIRVGRTVFFRGLLEEVRINILKDTPNQTPEQTGVMMAWWEGISVLQGDEPR